MVQLPLIFNYRVGFEDQCASHLVCEFNYAEAKAKRRRNGIQVLCIAAVLVGGAYGLWQVPAVNRSHELVFFVYLGGAVGVLLGIIGFNSLNTRMPDPNLAHQPLPPGTDLSKWEKQPAIRCLIGMQTLTISELGITEARKHTNHHVDWEEIAKVYQGPAHLFVKGNNGAVFILPFIAFHPIRPDELRRFIEELINKHNPDKAAST